MAKCHQSVFVQNNLSILWQKILFCSASDQTHLMDVLFSDGTQSNSVNVAELGDNFAMCHLRQK